MSSLLQLLLVICLAGCGAFLMHRRGQRFTEAVSQSHREQATAPFILAPSDVEDQLHELRRRTRLGQIPESLAVSQLSKAWGIAPSEAAEILRAGL